MPTENMTVAALRTDQLKRRLEVVKSAIEQIEEGRVLHIVVAGAIADLPVRLTDVGGFEIREAIKLDMYRHRQQIEAELADRQGEAS